jgi:glutamate racemase
MTENYRRYAIGVFDSGLGGLTAVKELGRIMPDENIIYFGDTARIPYGGRSRETVLKYAAEDVSFLRRFDIKMIIAACGTVSAAIEMPLADDILFTGVMLPAVKAACAVTKGKIGVIGTQATVKSGSYVKAVKQILPDAEVITQACPLFVPIVENGHLGTDDELARLVAHMYIDPLKTAGIDTLILGCTHYSLLSDVIAQILGEGVRLVTTGEEAAKFAAELLENNGLLNDSGNPGKNTYYVSDSPEMFTQSAQRFLGCDVTDVRMVRENAD